MKLQGQGATWDHHELGAGGVGEVPLGKDGQNKFRKCYLFSFCSLAFFLW